MDHLPETINLKRLMRCQGGAFTTSFSSYLYLTSFTAFLPLSKQQTMIKKRHTGLPIRFGNWEVAEDGVNWVGEYGYHPGIDLARLSEPRPDSSQDVLDWLVHLPEKTWMTEADTFALNTALFFAIDYFKAEMPKTISIAQTLQEQRWCLDDKIHDKQSKASL